MQESHRRASVNVAEAIPEAEEAIVGCAGVAPENGDQTLEVRVVEMALDVPELVGVVLVGPFTEWVEDPAVPFEAASAIDGRCGTFGWPRQRSGTSGSETAG